MISIFFTIKGYVYIFSVIARLKVISLFFIGLMGLAAKQFAAKHNDAVCSVFLHLGMNNVIRFSARSHAIEMVFIETGHAGGLTRSFMLKSFFIL